MRILVAVLLLTVPVLGQLFSDLNEQWENWKTKYQKIYQDQDEMAYRRMVWEKNLKLIVKHNQEASAGLHTFTMALNHLADMTTEEFNTQLNCVMEEDRIQFENVTFMQVSGSPGPLPRRVDWRGEGWVTRVRRQGICGSCWAFAAVGALEGQMKGKTGKLIILSPQNLVDCSKENNGCKDGWVYKAFNYIKRNGGIDSESSYPYEDKDTNGCRYSRRGKAAYCDGYRRIRSGSEHDLKYALAKVGPIAVSIFAKLESWKNYNGDLVYDDKACSSTLGTTHAVLVVGYGTTNQGQDYWLLKNSWGPYWGEGGYMRMARNKNRCGIANYPYYPIV